MPAEAAAPRPFWSGTISFGLVAVPVDLYPANRSGRVALRMVAPDGTPLSRRYFSHRGEEVSWEEIVRGAEVDDGRFVTVSDEELDVLAPEKSRDIDLTRFVDAAAIDPLYFQRAYYLTPAGDTTKAYRLLAAVMEDTGRAGIATFVMRGKEYLVAIFAENGILRAATLRFADEVRSAQDVGLPEPETPPKKAVDRLARAIRAAARPALDERELEDEDSRRLLAVAREKLEAGEDVLAPPVLPDGGEESEGAEVVDLMEVIKRNLRGRATPPAPARRPARRTERPGRKKGSARPKSAAKPAASGTQRAGRRAVPDLAELSKEELYERARRADVPGRSGMSKQELIRALKRSA
ncbi:MAG TPA: Ku protein [Thermoanaerobaculia bacterium]|nr:Ku protein [Thermoanaerobaculia bacterium]